MAYLERREVTHVLAHAVLRAVVRARQPAARTPLEARPAVASAQSAVAVSHVAALHVLVRDVCARRAVEPRSVRGAGPLRAVRALPALPAVAHPHHAVSMARAEVIAREPDDARREEEYSGEEGGPSHREVGSWPGASGEPSIVD